MATEEDKLKALRDLENQKAEENATEEVQPQNSTLTETVNEISGYKVLDRSEIPFFGKLYPETWKFAYRCPTTSEIADFSTIDERDQLKIWMEISKLISKCYMIVDTENKRQINSRQINDGEKLFFFLKLREFYLGDSPIVFQTMSRIAESVVEVTFVAHNLIYEGLNEELLECYDGRTWTIPTEEFGLTDPIIFLNPTLEITDRIYKYIRLKSQKMQEDDKKVNADDLNKKFLLILPFLYITGDENIDSLNVKFKNQIVKNEKLFKAYLELTSLFNLTHKDKILFKVDEDSEEEETEFKFPGGWKKMFLSNKTTFGKLFGK